MSSSNTPPPTPWVQPLNPSTTTTPNPPSTSRSLSSLPNFRNTPPGLDTAEAAAVAAAMQGEAVLEALSDPAGSSGLDSIARLLAKLVQMVDNASTKLDAQTSEIAALRTEVAHLRQEVLSLKPQP